MIYKLIRSILFQLEPELSHNFSLKAIKLLEILGCLHRKTIPLPRKVFGIDFPNPIGLAAGLDKNGDYIKALCKLGFGFIEIGTVTPKPQPGNVKPRLFRLETNQALINRMGFNNKGVDHLVAMLEKQNNLGVIGINIGKNASTPLDHAIDDYCFCYDKVHPYASYVTVNISSPNTTGLRDLQGSAYLSSLLAALKDRQLALSQTQNRYVPIVVKVSPDLNQAQIEEMAAIFIQHHVDGIIATNTAIDRTKIKAQPLAAETGGLSGEPIFELSTQVLSEFKRLTTGHAISLIASGGVMSPEQAIEKFKAGADLVQLYTGLIYQGPSLISKCCKSII